MVFYWQLFQLDSLSEFGAANLQDKKLEVLNQEMREEPDRFDRIQNYDRPIGPFFAERKAAKYNMKHVKP